MKPLPPFLCVLTLAAGCALPHRQTQSVHLLETFDRRPDGLVRRETWRDSEGGGGFFLFTDPQVQAMSAIHTNQTALGGGSAFTAGAMTVLVDTNTDKIIGVIGTAAGNVIGAAAKSAIK
jgi:hypothetical protein